MSLFLLTYMQRCSPFSNSEGSTFIGHFFRKKVGRGPKALSYFNLAKKVGEGGWPPDTLGDYIPDMYTHSKRYPTDRDFSR